MLFLTIILSFGMHFILIAQSVSVEKVERVDQPKAYIPIRPHKISRYTIEHNPRSEAQYLQLKSPGGLYYHPLQLILNNETLPKYFSEKNDYGRKYILLRHEDQQNDTLHITYTLLQRVRSQPVHPLYFVLSINKKTKVVGPRISFRGKKSNIISSSEVKIMGSSSIAPGSGRMNDTIHSYTSYIKA